MQQHMLEGFNRPIRGQLISNGFQATRLSPTRSSAQGAYCMDSCRSAGRLQQLSSCHTVMHCLG